MKRLLFVVPLSALIFAGAHLAWSPRDSAPSGQTHYVNLFNKAEAQTPLFSVTINDTISWNPIPGAHFEVIVLNTNPGSALDPPGVIGTGALNEVAVSVLLAGKPLGIYFIRGRSMNPDGSGKSDWSPAADGEFELVAFEIPSGFGKKP